MQEGLPFWIATLLGVALTLGIAIAPFPESTIVTSADGVVTITGVARKTQSLNVTESDEATAAPLVSAVYALTAASPLEVPVTVGFHASSLGVDDDLALYHWSSASMMWEQVALGNVTRTTDLGLYALGLRFDVDAPAFLSMYDDLRARAPIGTRGYVIDVGYSVSGGPVTRLLHGGEYGGCDGVFGGGSSEERSTATTSAMTMVDDVQTLVTYHFTARFSVEKESVPCVLHYSY